MEFAILSCTTVLILFAYMFGGMADAVCGGGGLITLPALMATGMPVHTIVGSNQCSMLVGTWTACAEYKKAGKIDMNVVKIALPFSFIGAFIGSKLNLLVDDKYLQIVMVVLIPILAIFSFVKRNISDEDHSAEIDKRTFLIGSILISFFVSIYHAFYGPASGVFFMVSLVSILKFDAIKANGIARFLLACINLVTTAVYAMSGNILWKVVVIATIGYMVGSYIGAKIAITKGAKVVRPLYYIVLVGLLIKLIYSFVA